MKRKTVAYASLSNGEIAPITMDKRCYKTFGEKLQKEKDFGKRFPIWDYYMKRRTRREQSNERSSMD